MTDDPPECLQCGACCDFPEQWSIVDVDLDDQARIPGEMTTESFGDWRKMLKAGNRCVALVGTVGLDARCGIYEARPKICRDYDPVARKAECNACRDHHSLTPL